MSGAALAGGEGEAVRARLSARHVGAGPAVQSVPAVAAGDDIVEPVARRLAAAARDREVLDVVRKLVAHPCLHGVGAGGGTFNDAIAGAADVVDVVARETGEGRRPAAVTPEVRSEERRGGKECVSPWRSRGET